MIMTNIERTEKKITENYPLWKTVNTYFQETYGFPVSEHLSEEEGFFILTMKKIYDEAHIELESA